MKYLRQSTSVDEPIGPFLDETDGKTAETALTITQADIRLKKNGGAWAQKNAAQTLSHEENGWYEVTLDATDTNTVGNLVVAIHESGALPVWQEYTVLEEAIYDALFAASANAWSGAAGSTTLTALASGSITAAVVATGAIDADAIADNAIDAGAIATGAITAAKFAAGAIDAAALAADAGTEIGTAVWATAARTLTAATNITSTGGTVPITGDGHVSSQLANVAHGGAAATLTLSDLTTENLFVTVGGSVTLAEFFPNEISVGTFGVTGNFTVGGDVSFQGDWFVSGSTTWTGELLLEGGIDTPSINSSGGAVDITANIAGNLSGSVGSVTGAVGSIGANGITSTSIANDAITDAKIAVPAETTGRPTRVLAMLRRSWEWVANKRIRTRATGVVQLRNDADNANLETATQSTAGGVGAEVDTQTEGA